MLTAGFAPAQDQPDTSPRDQQEPTYEAPSVLSRSAGLLGSNRKPFEFGMFTKISTIYDSGLTLVNAPSFETPLAPQGAFGVEASFGAAVSRHWRLADLTVEYRGVYRQYANAPLFNGFDQFLQIAYRRTVQRHLVLDLRGTLGSTTLASGEFAYLAIANLDRLGLPANDLFDNRSSYLESRVDLTWQKTDRLSFGMGGDGFIVRRQSLLLAGLNGYSERASVAYRLTLRQTISASYNNTYFDFQRAFGNSRLQIPTLGYSANLSRHWDFSTQAGAARVQTLGLTQVTLDPAIAALTGQAFATVTFSNVSYVPVAEARLARAFKTSTLTFDYAMGVTPGNGYYLTSRQTSAAIGYSYIAGKSWEARGNLGYNELSALGQALGQYTNLQGGGELFYNLTPAAHLDIRYDYRHYTTGNAILQKDSNRVSLGVAFSLGETYRTVR